MTSLFLMRREMNFLSKYDAMLKTQLCLSSLRMKDFVSLQSPAMLEYLEEDEFRQTGQPKDVINTNSLVAILTDSGIGICYLKDTKETIILNHAYGERISAFFYNKNKQAIITVSKIPETWDVRSYDITDLEEGIVSNAVSIFSALHPRFWPRSIQFDELNEKMITHHSLKNNERACVVYDLNDYKAKFHTITTNAHSVQISKGLLILTQLLDESVLHFKILCIETGEFLRDLHFVMLKKKLDFSVAFNEVIIIKPKGGFITILNIVTGEYNILKSTRQIQQSRSFLVPLRHNFFVTNSEHESQVWDFHGKKLASFENLSLCSHLFTLPNGKCIGFRFCYSNIFVLEVETGTTLAVIPWDSRHWPVLAVTYDSHSNTLVTTTSEGFQIWSQ